MRLSNLQMSEPKRTGIENFGDMLTLWRVRGRLLLRLRLTMRLTVLERFGNHESKVPLRSPFQGDGGDQGMPLSLDTLNRLPAMARQLQRQGLQSPVAPVPWELTLPPQQPPDQANQMVLHLSPVSSQQPPSTLLLWQLRKPWNGPCSPPRQTRTGVWAAAKIGVVTDIGP